MKRGPDFAFARSQPAAEAFVGEKWCQAEVQVAGGSQGTGCATKDVISEDGGAD